MQLSIKDTTILESDSGAVKVIDIENSLRITGLDSGDIVMVHSRLFSLGRVAPGITKDYFTDLFIDTLLDVIGPEGTLIFPTFTFSTCKTGVFDVAKTGSEVGVLSERARHRKDSVRTLHPIFSVALFGKRIGTFQNASINTCFGENSLFDLLHQLNSVGSDKGKVKFVTIGVDIPTEAVTYVHSIEEKMQVPYRYNKNFQCVVRADNKDFTSNVQFYVRDLSTDVVFDANACWNLLKTQDGVVTTRFGDSLIALLPEATVFNCLVSAIKEQSDFLCLGGYKVSNVQIV